jgi:hypothetical protein
MTITIKNKDFSSNINLANILNVMTKVEMLKICDKLELYVSPNLKKDETARRVAREILDNPEDVLHVLNKQELQLVDEFVKAGANHYAVRKMRKTYYKLQQYGLVLTYKDMEHEEWHMLMPDSVRQSLAPYCQDYLDLAEAGQKLPSKKQLRMMAALNAFMRKD